MFTPLTIGSPILEPIIPKDQWTLAFTGVNYAIMQKMFNPQTVWVTYINPLTEVPPVGLNVPKYSLANELEFKDAQTLRDVYIYPVDKDAQIRLSVSGDVLNGSSEPVTSAFGDLSVAEFRVHSGWTFAYNINPGTIREQIINGGVVSHSGNMAVCSSGIDPNGVAFIRTDASLSYTPGIGALVRFTVLFDTPQENSQQLIGLGDNSDGWFFGYNGLDFGILRRAKGIDTWIKQTDWSENVRASLDPTKGNVYQIRFQWLGFGMQYFGIEDSDSGKIMDVHRIKYANLNTETSVDVPSLPIAMGVANSGNIIPLSIKSPSAIAGSEGEAFPEPLTTLEGYEYPLTPMVIGDNYLFSIKNPGTYAGKDNKLYLEPRLLTLAVDGTRAITFKVLFNAVLTGAVFADISPLTTPAQADTVATAFSGGQTLLSLAIARDDTAIIDLASILGAKQWADTTLTIIATADQAGSDVAIGYTFRSRI